MKAPEIDESKMSEVMELIEKAASMTFVPSAFGIQQFFTIQIFRILI